MVAIQGQDPLTAAPPPTILAWLGVKFGLIGASPQGAPSIHKTKQAIGVFPIRLLDRLIATQFDYSIFII